jgi:hypothetical protein
MNPWFRRCLPLLSFSSAFILANPAMGQNVSTADALYNRGLAEMKAGRYETGCKALAESQRLDPQLGTLFTLATCEAGWGHIATARTHFDDYLTLYSQLPPAQQARQGNRPQLARQQRDQISQDVPELTLSLPPGAPTNVVVKRDGEVMGEAAVGIGLPVDPGEHVVSTQVPGGSVWEQRITIGKGEKKQLTLGINPAPAESDVAAKPAPSGPQIGAPQASDSQAPGGRRTAAYVAGGVGVAGLIVGGVTGALAMGKKSVVNEHCGSGIDQQDEEACDPTGLAASHSMKTFGLVSTLGFGVALAGLGTAGVLFFTDPARKTSTTATGSRWVSAGLLSAGPEGALVGARGVW